MKQFVLDYLAEQSAQSSRIAAYEREPGSTGADADLQIRLKEGRTIALYIINRAIRVPEIRERYEQNTRARLHTLFVVDGRMVPAEGMSVEPPGWLAALHTLAHGRVYAYWCEGRQCVIRPLHMDWKWGGGDRHIEYGAPVQLDSLRASRINVATRTIDGDYATADFGEGAFWKKNDPNEARQGKYSWRTWNFGARQKATPPPEPETPPNWEPWDDFQHYYGDSEGFTHEGFPREGFTSDGQPKGQRAGGRASERARGRTHANARESAQANSRNRSTDQRAYSVLTRHYATLGLPLVASLDEVKRAYRIKAREFHPDLHPDNREQYTSKMAEINAAFEAISRDKQRESS